MNARTVLLAWGTLAALVLPACSDDTGILVEVHGNQLELAVARLDTMVILDDGTGQPPSSADWGGADNRQDAIADELDLRSTPYKVMFRPDGIERDATVWVAAIAYDGAGDVIGFGELDAPVAFVPDAVKLVALTLHPASTVSDGCIAKDGQVVVRTSNDCDGDGFGFDVDCDDLDAQIAGDTDGDPVVCDGDCDMTSGDIFPFNQERCDGVDNDCDPTTVPLPQLCVEVVREGDAIIDCRVGQQLCNDLQDNGGFGACNASPLDLGGNGELCAAWAACLDAGQPQGCLVEGGLQCKLKSDMADACLPATVALHDLLPDGVVDCSFRLIGNVQQGNWNVGLRLAGDAAPPATFVAGCDAEFVVTAANLVPRIFVVEAVLDNVAHLFSVAIGPRRSDCDPSQPSELGCEVIGP